MADDYYCGLPMPLGLNRHRDKLMDTMWLLQITPLLPKAEIYFEPGTDVCFAARTPANLRAIRLTPEYRIRLNVK